MITHIFSFFQVLEQMVSHIMTVPGISRVMYDLTAKPPGTTEWE
jgi:GMP synthase (glutamine-hydrolysing)